MSEQNMTVGPSTRRDMLRGLTKVRDEMIANGYHFPNEWLLEIDFCISTLGGIPHPDNAEIDL